MLLLRRRRGQSIVIGRHAEITVKIIEEKDGTITLGIAAPKAILVDREEVYRKRQAEPQAPEFSEELMTERGCHHVTA
jgi:carbon storage regulator